MDTEMGLFWKTAIEKMYQDLRGKEVVFFSPEDETNLEEQFKELRFEQKAARKESRSKIFGSAFKYEPTKDEPDVGEASEHATSSSESGSYHADFHEPLVANA